MRAQVGLVTEPDATPAEALVQACGACHNDVLDQSISRARFNIALARMSDGQRALAIERISLAADDPLVMPPKESRGLAKAVASKLVEYLRLQTRAVADDALLERAAAWGMLGTQTDEEQTVY